MGDLTKNFSRFEFACKCGCGFDTVDFLLVIVLQDVADHFGKRVLISGGNRCFQRNLDTPGAARDSEHVKGKAADIKVEDTAPKKVYDYLNKKYPNKFGIGLYSNRTHIDVREYRARWDSTKTRKGQK